MVGNMGPWRGVFTRSLPLPASCTRGRAGALPRCSRQRKPASTCALMIAGTASVQLAALSGQSVLVRSQIETLTDMQGFELQDAGA